MKHSLLHLALVSSVFIADISSFNASDIWNQLFVSWKTKTETPHTPTPLQAYVDDPVFQTLDFNLISESSTALEADSLILVELFNNTAPWINSSGQIVNWDLNQPVNTWNGITLDPTGCVTRIILVDVGMTGSLPSSIGNLTCLEILDLGRNRLVGPIPSTIGNLSNLEVFKVNDNYSASSGMSGQIPKEMGNLSNLTALWLDGNRFSDTIPKELGRLNSLGTLFLDENEFEGAIPDSFIHLTNLTKLDIFENKLDSLPDLSSINSLFIQNNRFEIQDNRFTFDDILPNTGTALGDNYFPQDSFLQEQTVSLFTGATYRIELGIDAGIPDNEYQWYKNGFPYMTTNVNYLDLSPIQLTDAGVYRCEVTNDGAELLTLYSRNVTIQVNCGTSVNDFNATVCDGEEIIINGNPYGCNNLDGTEFIPGGDQYGCDSIINIMLVCSQPITIDSMPTICPDGFIEINGEIYNLGNPEGTEVISSPTGCDTTINVELSFFSTPASSNLNETICLTDSVTVNGTVYKFGSSSGTEILDNQNFRGCDSIVNIDLNFYPEVVQTFDQMLCSGGSITVNNVVYDEITPTGRDTLFGAAENGCDSIVVIDLSFGSFSSSNLDVTICPGDSIDINGVIHHENFTTSTDTLVGFNSCDSLVFINVDFYDENRVFYAPFLCDGETVFINGTEYGQAPLPSTGVEHIDMSPDCDSIVEVFLNFHLPIGDGLIEPTLCGCDPFEFNGTTYDCNTPSGTEVIEGVAANGCDSTYQINLIYLPNSSGEVTLSICEGGTVEYNGTTYDVNNQTGTETMMATNGCDSIVDVTVAFFTPTPGNFSATVCEGETYEYNGTTYDVNMPSGLETLAMQGLGGCDSTVIFNLFFYPDNEVGNFTPTICPGTSIEFGGQTFDEGTPTGMVNVTGALNGCDSTVNVLVSFFAAATDELDTIICASANFMYNGTLYGNGGLMSGTEVFSGASSNGCDLIVSVNVANFNIPQGNYSETICLGDNFMYNGTLYGNGGLDSGTETIMSFQGCDSTVNVSVLYHPESQIGVFAPTICSNSDTLFNNVLYNSGNFSDLVVLDGIPDQYGCDSTVQVEVSFYPEIINNINETLCEGTSILVNGIVYDVDNPSGSETIIGGAENGCDSIVNVDLSFNTFVVNNIDETLCDCDTLIVNNIIYDCNNASGTETLVGASYIGCDSIINVDLNFMIAPVVNFSPTLCSGETVIVNGTLYSESMSTGIEVFGGGTNAGCDSTVNVNLNFHEPVITQIDTIICDGEVIINGNPYHPGNTPSTVVIADGAFTGCDSTVVISVDYFEPVLHVIDQMLCNGQTIEVNGNTYGDGFPLTGMEVVTMGSSNGCDSTISINLTIANVINFDLDPTICEDDFVAVNGNIYNFDTPMGTETLMSIAGCDSVVNIDLSFFDPAIENINQSFCECQDIEVNGTIYNCDNTSGTEMLQSVNGCDSIINVNLEFLSSVSQTIDQSFCECQDVEVNGTIYNCDNPTGIETLQAFNGCDSIINVNLSFFSDATENVDQSFCECQDVEINGTIYNCDNPTGTEMLQTVNGCDSTIIVNLNFGTSVSEDINTTFCECQAIDINGTIYDCDNPSGTEMLQSVNGCDSIINVDLNFLPAVIETVDPTLCEGASITVNGNIYDMDNPSGTEVFMGVTANGCDSTVIVDLSFSPAITENINTTFCECQEIQINGTIYDCDNPSGTEMLQSVNGCDSIINVDLNFLDPIVEDFNPTLCEGASVVVNGTTYDESNTSGTEVFVSGSANGCDSTVMVDLSFAPSIIENINTTFCECQDIEINGTIYNCTNPSGTEMLQSVAGCDSIINIDLNFLPEVSLNYTPTFCSNESELINGTLYDSSNPSGTEVFEGVTINGCDSTVNINMTFLADATNTINNSLCTGESLVVNGTTYDENNPQGTEILSGASFQGCDSTINVALNFSTAIETELNEEICSGSSFIINNTAYNSTGTFTETITGGSSQGCDSVIILNLVVMDASALGQADAGSDFTECTDILELNANQPANTTGEWTSLSGATFDQANVPNSMVSDLNAGSNLLVWTLSTDLCPNYDSDTLSIEFIAESPIALEDQFDFPFDSSFIELDLVGNDELNGSLNWSANIIDAPEFGAVENLGQGFFQYFPALAFPGGEIAFTYELCNTDCANLCDTAQVIINIEALNIDPDIVVPSGITPNDDGVNDFFIIPDIQNNPDRYTESELIVYNRWGDVVYSARPYNNDWDGRTNAGKDLPQGTYYYLLRIEFSEGKIYKGDVTILK